MLSKGQEWDWFGDPFYRVQTLLLLFVVQLVCARSVARLRIANPLINFRTLADRNFRAVLHHHFLRVRRAVCQHDDAARPAAIAVRLRRDDARVWCCRRPGMFAVMMLFVVGALLGRGVDARYLMAAGLLTLASATSGCRG